MKNSVLASMLRLAGLPALASAAILEVAPGHSSIRYLGRPYDADPTSIQWAWSGSGAAVAFTGTSCSIHLQAQGIFRVLVDGVEKNPLDLTSNSDTLHALASGLASGNHFVEIRQKTEAQNCTSRFRGFRIDGVPATLPAAPSRRIEFYGNSITCGYGILDSIASNGFAVKTEDEGRTFASQAADSLGAEHHTVCWSGRGVVQNYNRDTINPTLPKLYRQILPWDATHLWDFSRWIPQVVVIDLGTNDFSHVAPDSTKFRKTYAAMVDSLHARYPDARFVLVEGPMLSDGYPSGLNALSTIRRHLDTIVAAVKSRGIQATHLSLTPQGNLGYGADYHPSLRQAALNGQELTAHLRAEMGWSSSGSVGHRTNPGRAEIVRTASGAFLRLPEGESGKASILDAAGKIRWSRTVQANSTTSLPHQLSGRWLVVESAAGRRILPLQPALR